jgi:hypothetical protein
MTSLSKHFMATDVSSTGRQSFRLVTLVFLGTGTMVVCLKHVGIVGPRDYGGLLETCCYYRLRQGEVENVSEDTCQLVSACSEYTSW